MMNFTDKESTPGLDSASIWIEEVIKDFTGLRFRLKETLFSGKSKFQSVSVVDTYHHGRMLLNDGLVMCTEKDEFCYHEMIAHIPLFTHPSPKRVLIIGGGDGGTAREVLRHQKVEKCVMVEIDKMVVDACQKFLPQTAAVLTNDSRLELIIDDGVKYAKETKEKFDVILVDSTDPIGPAAPLFNLDFYSDLSKALNDDGIVVAQGESPFYFAESQVGLAKIISQAFPLCGVYNFCNLTYPGGLWSFVMGSKKYNPLQDFSVESVKRSNLEFDFYNSSLHKACFSLPNFQRRSLNEWVNLNP